MPDTPEQVGWPLNTGAPASPSGRREPDPQAVPALRASVPSADELPSDCPWEVDAEDAAKLGQLFREIQSQQYGCGGDFECSYPHDGNCWCFNTALSRHIAQAIEARRAETGTGSVHESAVRQDAPETSSSGD